MKIVAWVAECFSFEYNCCKNIWSKGLLWSPLHLQEAKQLNDLWVHFSSNSTSSQPLGCDSLARRRQQNYNPPTPAPPKQPNFKTPFPQWCFDLEVFVCSLWHLCPATCIADAESVLEVSARATWESALVQLSGESHSLLEISTRGHHWCKHSLALKSGWLSWSNKRGFSLERRRTRQAGWISPFREGILTNSIYH